VKEGQRHTPGTGNNAIIAKEVNRNAAIASACSPRGIYVDPDITLNSICTTRQIEHFEIVTVEGFRLKSCNNTPIHHGYLTAYSPAPMGTCRMSHSPFSTLETPRTPNLRYPRAALSSHFSSARSPTQLLGLDDPKAVQEPVRASCIPRVESYDIVYHIGTFGWQSGNSSIVAEAG
jgi:hypothetical protein